MLPVNRELLDKYIQGQCTPQEESIVLRWLDKNDIEDYPDVHSEKKYNSKERAGWQQLIKHFDELQPVSERKKFFGRKWIWAAATIAVIIGFSVYFSQSRLFDYATKYQTSYGEVKRITLTDGTTVTLNARSVLEVKRGFGQKNRTVYLEGEAFFEVKQKAEEPFMVNTKKLSVAVLGTSFNVSAFANDQEQTVSLKKGKVRVELPSKKGSEDIILTPGEEIKYSKSGDAIKVGKVNNKEILSWQKQIIYFEDASIDDVVNKLERFYGVHIDIRYLHSRNWQLTGEYKNATLEEILESLSFNYNLKYKIEGGRVILYEK